MIRDICKDEAFLAQRHSLPHPTTCRLRQTCWKRCSITKRGAWGWLPT